MRNRPWKASENVCCVLSTCKSFNIQIIKFDSFRDPKDFKRHPLKEQGQGYITSSTTEALLADEYTAKVNIGMMNVYAIQASK